MKTRSLMTHPFSPEEPKTDFGDHQIPLSQKTSKVAAVFRSVASQYDLMNDLMSLGIHRLWKRYALALAHVRPGQCILDLAGGTGDLTIPLSQKTGSQGRVILSDINEKMLEKGRNRVIDAGCAHNVLYVQADAEKVPFSPHTFDLITMSFGLRNVTDKMAALHSMYQVLKPGGQLLILEFSHPTQKVFSQLYDAYSFNILPRLGKWIAQDEASYRYLVESIRHHPTQETLKEMLVTAGFCACDYQNLTGGIVAIHRGFKE